MPHTVLRGLLRAPVALYRCHCGWLLGHRFLLLTHTGRRTGRRHRTVLEVLEYRPAGPELVVMSGFGARASWFRNIQANDQAALQVGLRCFPAMHRILPVDEAASALAGYERRHFVLAPLVRMVLRRLLGWRYEGTDADRRRAVTQLPLVAFRPRAAHPAA